MARSYMRITQSTHGRQSLFTKPFHTNLPYSALSLSTWTLLVATLSLLSPHLSLSISLFLPLVSFRRGAGRKIGANHKPTPPLPFHPAYMLPADAAATHSTHILPPPLQPTHLVPSNPLGALSSGRLRP
ncbi:hypothetical protein IE53DRAFT_178556 [Violaceomyces palustris]|uniref:Uncharacterized protein n=1 Tax=Violaceomyces palustris TaxID=1673888 RepID=A0ACD0NSH7_9BASI|nr:hypothetical protein IE53DRAFT_178556 [Violaceomyces palustris]